MIFLNIGRFINIFYNFTPINKVLNEISFLKMNNQIN